MLTINLTLIFLLPAIYFCSNIWTVSSIIFFLISAYILISFSDNLFRIRYWSIIDNLSSLLIILSLWIAAIILLARIKINLKNTATNKNIFLFYVLLLLFTLLNSFSSSNLIIFYIWFEASLIPTILIIMSWGYQPERLQARIYFIIYTVVASLPILLAFISSYYTSKSSLISLNTDFWAFFINSPLSWLLIILGFLVKLPIYSTHLWLPKAHVEAPVAGSIILAAILLKLGGYGLLRIRLVFPYIPKKIHALILRISMVGAVLTRLICIRQTDLKSLIAYSSVGHIGLMLGGTITSTKWGIIGAIAIIVAHGFRSSALFMLANINYEAIHTRRLILSKGILLITPTISLWWFIFAIINIAAPPSINLLREIILITSIISTSIWVIILLGRVRFLTAAYSLYLYTAVNHGHKNLCTNPYLTL